MLTAVTQQVGSTLFFGRLFWHRVFSEADSDFSLVTEIPKFKMEAKNQNYATHTKIYNCQKSSCKTQSNKLKIKLNFWLQQFPHFSFLAKLKSKLCYLLHYGQSLKKRLQMDSRIDINFYWVSVAWESF
jgi:hypothetical protein